MTLACMDCMSLHVIDVAVLEITSSYVLLNIIAKNAGASVQNSGALKKCVVGTLYLSWSGSNSPWSNKGKGNSQANGLASPTHLLTPKT